jgi:uncharacterized protein YeeX (DUF496 family)
MSGKASLSEKIKLSKQKGNEARNATYQLRSDLNELIDLNGAISSITFLGTRQLLNQQRNDLLENIFEKLESLSDLSNLIDIEDVKLSLETLFVEHRTYLNLQLQEINKKVIETEELHREINDIRDRANQKSLEFNASLTRFVAQLETGDLSTETLGTSASLILDEYEKRLNDADAENASVIAQTGEIARSIREKAEALEKKILEARKNRANLEKLSSSPIGN